jgi:hypothetical protein
MDAVEKELEGRTKNIKREVELLFKANMKFTDWDVPEADDTKVAKIIMKIMKEALEEIEEDIKEGKYENY